MSAPGERDAPPERGWTRAWVALGSNSGHRRGWLDRAIRALRADPDCRVRRVSRWIETDPVGGPEGQRAFRNGVLELETRLGAIALLERLQAIEAACGRDRAREVPSGPRTLDLDLLLYGSLSVQGGRLTVPHPRLEERRFVLEPLAQLAPDLVLPRSGRTVAERLRELEPHEPGDGSADDGSAGEGAGRKARPRLRARRPGTPRGGPRTSERRSH